MGTRYHDERHSGHLSAVALACMQPWPKLSSFAVLRGEVSHAAMICALVAGGRP